MAKKHHASFGLQDGWQSPFPLFLLWAITNWIQATLLDKEAMLGSLEGPDMWVLKPYGTSSRVEPEGNSSPSCNLIANVWDAKCRQSHLSPVSPLDWERDYIAVSTHGLGVVCYPAINNWNSLPSRKQFLSQQSQIFNEDLACPQLGKNFCQRLGI